MPPTCKQLHQVMELPVDVTAHSHRAVDRLHIRLLDKNLLHLDFFFRHTISTFIQHIGRAHEHKLPIRQYDTEISEGNYYSCTLVAWIPSTELIRVSYQTKSKRESPETQGPRPLDLNGLEQTSKQNARALRGYQRVERTVQYVFAEGLELVLGEVLPLLDLSDPQIQIHNPRQLKSPAPSRQLQSLCVWSRVWVGCCGRLGEVANWWVDQDDVERAGAGWTVPRATNRLRFDSKDISHFDLPSWVLAALYRIEFD